MKTHSIHIGLLFILLSILMLSSYLSLETTASGHKEIPAEYCIVYDNSGSTFRDETWKHLKYISEMLASMVDYQSGEQFSFYPMFEISSRYDITASSTKPLKLTSYDDIKLISEFYTPKPGGNTPYSPLDEAYQYLKTTSTANNKYLIILTDGIFDDIANNNLNLQSRLKEMAVNSKLHIHYLACGDGTPLKEDKSNGLYTYFADRFSTANTNEIITKIYCNIFGYQMTPLESSSQIELAHDFDTIVFWSSEENTQPLSLINLKKEKLEAHIDTGIHTYATENISTTKPDHAKPQSRLVLFKNLPKGTYQISTQEEAKYYLFYSTDSSLSVIDKTPKETDNSNPLNPLLIILGIGTLLVLSVILILKKKQATTAPISITTKLPSDKYVFISYSTKDASKAYFIKEMLERHGINCWMAPDSIPGGSNYLKEIPMAIRNCSAFVFLLSKHSQHSDWVPLEVEQAYKESKPILPFALDNYDLLDQFFMISRFQRIDGTQNHKIAVMKLIERTIALLNIEK